MFGTNAARKFGVDFQTAAPGMSEGAPKGCGSRYRTVYTFIEKRIKTQVVDFIRRLDSLLWLRTLFRKARRKLARRTSRWELDSLGVARRVYRDYDAYVRHQRRKLDEKPETVEYFDNLIAQALPERVADLPLNQARVVCIASRRGGEVRAFRSHGAFAFGIDIAPGLDNPYTVHGDMHHLEEIAPSSADITYTNSLDHSFDLEAALRAVHRILRPDGLFIVELMSRNDAGEFESRRWDSADEIIAAMTAPLPSGQSQLDSPALFHVQKRMEFKIPWDGIHVRLKKLS